MNSTNTTIPEVESQVILRSVDNSRINPLEMPVLLKSTNADGDYTDTHTNPQLKSRKIRKNSGQDNYPRSLVGSDSDENLVRLYKNMP